MLRLRSSNSGGVGSLSGQGTKIPHAVLWDLKKKKKILKKNDLNQLLTPLLNSKLHKPESILE